LNQWYPAKGVFNKSYPKDVILNEWGKAEEKLVVDYLGNLYVHSKEGGSPERETFVVTIFLLDRMITRGDGVLFNPGSWQVSTVTLCHKLSLVPTFKLNVPAFSNSDLN